MSTENPPPRAVLAETRDSLNNLHAAMVRTNYAMGELHRLIQEMETTQAPERVIGVATHRLNDEAPAQPQQRPEGQVTLKGGGFRREAVPNVAPPAKQPLTTEQIIVRVIAVLGTIITVIGVGFGINLAIQNGLLGPLGRVLLAGLLAAALFVAGLYVERKTTATAGSTALYATSYFVAAITLIAPVVWLDWWSTEFGSIVLLVLFVAFAVFARIRRHPWLAVAMTIGALLNLRWSLFIGGGYELMALALPTILLMTTIPKNPRVILPGFHYVRIAASVLAIFTAFSTVDSNEMGTILPIIALVVYALAAAAIEAYSPQPRTQLLQLTIVPLILLLYSAAFSSGWVSWLIPLATAAGYVITQRADATNPLHKNLQEQSVAWLCFGALSIFALYVTFPLESRDTETRHFLVVAFFTLAFAAVTWLLRSQKTYNTIVWVAWAGVAVLLTVDFSPVFTRRTVFDLASPEIALQAVCFALVLVVGFLNREGLKGVQPGVLIGLSLVAMYLYLVVVVTIFSFLFALPFSVLAGFGYVVGHAFVSVSWILLAAWVLLSKRFLADRLSLIIGLVLAIGAAAKLVFFDLSSLDGITRAIAFTVSGIMLIVIATIRVRLSAKAREQH
ncbi:DUF2339 domain-containing protein [Corynebacterium sp. S7]